MTARRRRTGRGAGDVALLCVAGMASRRWRRQRSARLPGVSTPRMVRVLASWWRRGRPECRSGPIWLYPSTTAYPVDDGADRETVHWAARGCDGSTRDGEAAASDVGVGWHGDGGR
jgi:hypothetical protein